MQTPKKSLSKNGSSEVPKRTSPITPRSSRQVNKAGTESDSTPSACTGSKTPKSKSPKMVERKSPRSPAIEKKRPNKVAELESQITHLQEDLKKAKDQIASSELCKKKTEQEAEEAKKQSEAAAEKLDEVQKQMKELSDAEDARVQELRTIGQERDRAWQSELEAVQKQHSVDSAALFSAMNEVQRLKQQVETLSNSEVAQAKQAELSAGEIQKVKNELSETILLVSSLEKQLKSSEESEEEYQVIVNQTQVQLEMAKTMIETLKSDGSKVMGALNSTITELKECRAHARALEEALQKPNVDNIREPTLLVGHDEHALGTESDILKSEVQRLKNALEEVEMKFNEEQIKCFMQIQSVYDEAERIRSHSCVRESEFQKTIYEAKIEVAKLKDIILEKETLIQSMTNLKEKMNTENEGDRREEHVFEMDAGFQKSAADIVDLRARLEDKEIALTNSLDENRLLKVEMEKKESERIKDHDSAVAEINKARAAEHEALEKVEIATEEADKSSQRATRITEQLEAAQAANSEMETELRRLRIQSDQWRKAAEAAAAILTSGNNGNMMERTGSFGPDSNSLGGKLLNSPFSDDVDDESPKKKNNVLKKIGVLWKKGQK